MSSEKPSDKESFKLRKLPLEVLVRVLGEMKPGIRAVFAAKDEKFKEAVELLNNKFKGMFAEEFPHEYGSMPDKATITDWKAKYDLAANEAYMYYDPPYVKFYTAVKKQPFDIDRFNDAINAIKADLMAYEGNKVDYLKKFFSHSNAFEYMTLSAWIWKYRQSSHIARDVLNFIFENLVKPYCEDNQFLFTAAIDTHQSIEVVKALAPKIDANIADSAGNTPLIIACQTANVEAVDVVLKRGADVNRQNKTFHSALHYACARGNTKMVALLLENGAAVDVLNSNEDTPLHLACRANSPECVKLLLAHQASFEAQNDDDFSPLQVACEVGAFEVAELLVNAGTDVIAVEDDNYTPLALCCFHEDKRLFKFLLSKGANIDLALAVACLNNQLDVVKKLLENGANVHVELEDYVPIEAAYRNGHIEIVNVLLDAGAKLDYNLFKEILKNGDFSLAEKILAKKLMTDYVSLEQLLQLAADKGDERTVKLLSPIIADHKLVINQRRAEASRNQPPPNPFAEWRSTINLDYTQALDIFRSEGQGLRVAARLAHSPRVTQDVLDQLYKTLEAEYSDDKNRLLKFAIIMRQQPAKIVELLIALDEDSHAKQSSLLVAINEDDNRSIRALLDHGADPRVVDDEGYMPLSYAIKLGKVEVVEIFLEAGVHINDIFLMACQYGQRAVIEMLLDHGADVNVVYKGRTPLEVAFKAKKFEIVSLLLDEGATVSFALFKTILTGQYGFYGQIVDRNLMLDHESLVKFLINTNPKSMYFSVLSKAVNKIPLDTIKEILRDARGSEFVKMRKIPNQKIIDALIALNKEYQEKLAKSFPLWYGRMNKNSESINWKAEYELVIEKGLSRACEVQAVDVVKELLAAGLKPEGIQGVNALLYACKYGPLQSVELLVQQGADVNATNKSGYMPLILACGWNYEGKDNNAIVTFLVENGANKDVALLQSCKAGVVPAVSTLLNLGANINIKDDNGKSLMEIAYAAKMSRHDKKDILIANKLIDILLSQGAKVERPLFEKIIADGQLDLADKILRKGAIPDDKKLTSLLDTARDERQNNTKREEF